MLERLHLRGVGHLTVFFIERCADRAADQTAGERAHRGARDAIAGTAAADRSAEDATHEGAGHRAGILLRRRRISCRHQRGEI